MFVLKLSGIQNVLLPLRYYELNIHKRFNYRETIATLNYELHQMFPILSLPFYVTQIIQESQPIMIKWRDFQPMVKST